jgi:tetraacyldisaccharide 4'-kinase
MKPDEVHAVMSGADRGMRATLLRAMTRVVEPGYSGVMRLRNAMFDAGWRGAVDLGRPTISVGNLTTGGTGKTPMVIFLAQLLRSLGAKPGILLRGYRAGESGSDEEAVYRAALGEGVPVEADADRAAGARRLLAAHAEVNVLLLDDAFQRRQVKRDVDVVLLDAANPWGYGHVLPRGMLREPVSALRRADAVLLTHVDEVDAAALQCVRDRVQQITGKAPLAEASHAWEGFDVWRPGGETVEPTQALRGHRVLGVSGIGNPAAFERRLREHAGEVAACEARSDHAHYDAASLAAIVSRARQAGAAAVVTTEKDFVKWRPHLASVWPSDAPPIFRPRLVMRFSDVHLDRLTQLIAPLPLR